MDRVYNRFEENRHREGDIPADNIPAMDNDRLGDYCNRNIGVQPVPDEDRSNQEPPMQWDNPGNDNSELPMMRNERGNGRMKSDPGNQSSLQDHGKPEGGSESLPKGR